MEGLLCEMQAYVLIAIAHCNSHSTYVSSALYSVFCILLKRKVLDAWNYVLFVFVSPVPKSRMPCTYEGLNKYLLNWIML